MICYIDLRSQVYREESPETSALMLSEGPTNNSKITGINEWKFKQGLHIGNSLFYYGYTLMQADLQLG